ncbi:hypothetical protein SY83_02955 [Paenibacillus swuensis]|uniref:NAD-dependent epimerase/dehydratase domain-containing protein n=1 Tax=Paenibacillus swuensis TaxID=1178515 RepID=A0A172TEI8_9BACL|nr:NAD-dependent epimerase/dehydratase family protein [Paenibacillus swuensis]ANE45451.1 hypothetical protein SY83_02955 [Paenibacillus swuensis]
MADQLSKVLIFGGTRFFGKRLVERLLDQGCDVTIATRGTTPDDFGDRVTRLQLDREDRAALLKATEGKSWDVVYDNICYSPGSAADACDAFAGGKVKRYIFTSTLSVYEFGAGARREHDFDPYTYPVKLRGKDDFTFGEGKPLKEAVYNYAEGKRLAEAVFMRQADFPVCAVRFPIVLGTDDYTLRMQFHMNRVRDGVPIGIPNPDARMSFIRSDEAANFLLWLKDQDVSGPFNACASGSISVGGVIRLIEDELGRSAQTAATVEDSANNSPFGVPDDWYMDTTKAAEAGYQFTHLDAWLRALITELNGSTVKG